MLERINKLFPLWVVLISIAAFVSPGIFTGLKDSITTLLIVIMFTMGLTLHKDDFTRVLKSPKPIAVGAVLQFTIMPLTAYLVSKLFGLSVEATTGLVLVGATAGGTASNVMTWLAGGHVALSVSMTMCSTLISVLATPILTWLIIGKTIDVPVLDMLLSIIQLVIAPVFVGVMIHHVMGRKVAKIEFILPTVAMIAIMLIIAIVVALNAERLPSVGPVLILAVAIHNSIGFSAGYFLARALGFDLRTSRTISIEVGMQNSGLAVALANQFFSSGAALVGAIFSVWQNVAGSLLAGYWKRKGISPS